MSLLVHQSFQRGTVHNYLVDGRLCNAFALGALGSADDFFLVGAEPSDETNVPLITANLLHADGTPLCRLVRNVPVLNPGLCVKVLGAQPGYEIRDSVGMVVLKVETRLERLPGDDLETFVTTFAGTLFDRIGQVVFAASSGDEAEMLAIDAKGVFGFGDGFGVIAGMSSDEAEIARVVLASRGALHYMLTGAIAQKDLLLDGVIVRNAQISECRVQVSTGDFIIMGDANAIRGCNFEFSGAAENVRSLVLSLMQAT